MESIYVTKCICFKENPKMDPPRKCGLISLLPVPGQYADKSEGTYVAIYSYVSQSKLSATDGLIVGQDG